jgi:hypothetical protein
MPGPACLSYEHSRKRHAPCLTSISACSTACFKQPLRRKHLDMASGGSARTRSPEQRVGS